MFLTISTTNRTGTLRRLFASGSGDQWRSVSVHKDYTGVLRNETRRNAIASPRVYYARRVEFRVTSTFLGRCSIYYHHRRRHYLHRADGRTVGAVRARGVRSRFSHSAPSENKQQSRPGKRFRGEPGIGCSSSSPVFAGFVREGDATAGGRGTMADARIPQRKHSKNGPARRGGSSEARARRKNRARDTHAGGDVER